MHFHPQVQRGPGWRVPGTRHPVHTIERYISMKKLLIALFAMASLTVPTLAQTTYTYTGNPFTLFSCGPNMDNTGDIDCSTPGPNNYTLYTAANFVSGTLTFTNPLAPNLSLQDVTTLPGFQLSLNDGQHTVTYAIAVGRIVEVSTDASGNITSWWIVLNTGGTQNGGIATVNFVDTNSVSHVFDSGTLACCTPTIQGDLALNFGIAGSWTSGGGTPTPAALTTNLIEMLSDPLLHLTAGQTSSFTDKLNNALASIQAGQNKQAINQLNAFISSVQTNLKGGKISAQTATRLTNAAQAIIAALS
jgi:hypothetical protein